MKTKSIAIVGLLLLTFITLTSAKSIQEKQTFEGVFDGAEDYGYNFIGIDADGEEYTMTFQNIVAEALSAYDLKSDELMGTKFSVTYTSKIETIKDEDGYEEDVETNSILALKKL